MHAVRWGQLRVVMVWRVKSHRSASAMVRIRLVIDGLAIHFHGFALCGGSDACVMTGVGESNLIGLTQNIVLIVLTRIPVKTYLTSQACRLFVRFLGNAG